MSNPEGGRGGGTAASRGPFVLVKILRAGVVADGSGVAWPAGAPVYLRERDAVDASIGGTVEVRPGELSPQGLDYLACEGSRPYVIAGPKDESGPVVLMVAKRDGVMCANRLMTKGEVVQVPERVAYVLLRRHRFNSPDLETAGGFTLSSRELEAAWTDPKLDAFNVF